LLTRTSALTLSRTAVLTVLFVMAWERAWRLPGVRIPPEPFFYLGRTIRVAEVVAVLAAASFVLAGPPIRYWPRRGALRVFAVSALALVSLAALSSFWALYPALTAIRVVHLAIWAAFALVVAGAQLPPRRMATAFVLGLLAHAATGLGQMITQKYLGLTALGELPIRNAAPWSTIAVGASSLLRAHGLSPNPNVLAGHLAIGLILCWGLGVGRRAAHRWFVVVVWALLFATLLFTFSRSGLLAAVVGIAVASVWLARVHALARPVAALGYPLAIVATIGLVVFAAVFHHYLQDRLWSIWALLGPYGATDRRGLIDAAALLLASHPLGGVGAGNFSAATRTVTPGGVALDSVHNVPLLIVSELGLAGLILVGAMVAAVLVVSYRRWRERSAELWQGLVAGSLAALAVVGMLDHYLWSVPQGGLLGAWLVGWCLADEQRGTPAG
jgi:O-antigen ligase